MRTRGLAALLALAACGRSGRVPARAVGPVADEDPCRRHPLGCAVRHADVAGVRRLLASGASPSLSLPGGGTPLHLAASMGHLEIARLLLEAGAQVRAPASGQVQPLHRAIGASRLEMARFLLERGADPSAGSDVGTPLHAAVRAGPLAVELVDLLLSAGASVDPTNDRLPTPLAVIAASGRPDAVAVAARLLARGANANGCTPGTEPLTASIRGRDLGLAALLLASGADPDREGGLALREAARDGDVPAARLLLDLGADPGAHDEAGATALHEAAARNRLEVARLLLERGANAAAVDVRGRTPLHVAASSAGPGPELLELLLDRGAPINARDWVLPSGTLAGRTALDLAGPAAASLLVARGGKPGARADQLSRNGDLFAAVESGQLRGATQALEDGADPNAWRSDGVTPLMLAATRGHAELVRLLLEAGADPEADHSDSDTGFTALDGAVRNAHAEAAAVLLDRGARAAPRLYRRALEVRSLTLVRLLLEKRVPAGDALAQAIAAGETEIARALLSRGADPNGSAAAERPLLAAIRRNDLGLTASLLERGAAPGLAAADGRLPLHEAVRYASPGLVDLLLDHGAPVNRLLAERRRGFLPRGDGKVTALDLALGLEGERGHEIRAALLSHGARRARDLSGRSGAVRGTPGPG